MSVFYRSLRVGKHGKFFWLYKFRTMVKDAEYFGGPTTSANDPRITLIGRLLRKYKLDELPNLLNVLKGEMSLVGPRPYMPEDLLNMPEKTKEELLSVKPGMTDYASILFHDEAEEVKKYKDPHLAYLEMIKPTKLRLGRIYVEKKSFKTDMDILWKTTLLILRKIFGRG